jgi:hypothetical protein
LLYVSERFKYFPPKLVLKIEHADPPVLER